jgi:hypothetical protein
MSTPYDRMRKLEEEVGRLRKQVSTMRKMSAVIAGVSILAIAGIIFVFVSGGSFSSLSLTVPQLPFSLSSLNDSDSKKEANIASNPEYVDTDGDGVVDSYEKSIGTNPMAIDTDMDGLSDGEEMKRGSDPLNRNTDSDRYEDGVDEEPTIVNFADVIVNAYNLQIETKTDGNVVFEVLAGTRHLNPYTVLYSVKVDVDIKNVGTDYTSYARYDLVFTMNGEQVRRIPESIEKLDVGAMVTEHYQDEIRFADLPEKVKEQLGEGMSIEFGAEIQNISFDKLQI